MSTENTPIPGTPDTPERDTSRILSGKDRMTLPKSSRLRHRSLVEHLFREGRSVYRFPLRMTWRTLSDAALSENFRDAVPDRIGPVQILITVPKKKRRHAVDRVLMRRRIREAFRLNCASLRRCVENHPDIRTLSVAMVYMHNENMDFHELERRLVRLMERLENELTPKPSGDTDSPSDVNAQIPHGCATDTGTVPPDSAETP